MRVQTCGSVCSRAGAIGYLLKDTKAHELRRATKAAAAGQVQLSPKAAGRLIREVVAPVRPETLSDREVDVLGLVARLARAALSLQAARLG